MHLYPLLIFLPLRGVLHINQIKLNLFNKGWHNFFFIKLLFPTTPFFRMCSLVMLSVIIFFIVVWGPLILYMYIVYTVFEKQFYWFHADCRHFVDSHTTSSEIPRSPLSIFASVAPRFYNSVHNWKSYSQMSLVIEAPTDS